MAVPLNLGGVFTTDTDGNLSISSGVVSTENVVGLVFDTSIAGGLSAALGSNTTAYATFKDGNVVELNSLSDATKAGIDETVFGGLVSYHVSQFFKLAGSNQRLFLSFMNSDEDTNFEAVEQMQLASGGIIYQIGVWTGKAVANAGDDEYEVPSSNIITKLQAVAETLGGTIGQINYEGNAPVNILLNAPVIASETCDYTKLPDVNALGAPKVSYILGQGATTEVHNIQLAINNIKSDSNSYAVVGNLGAALACLAIAPADESIAHVASFNLAAAMTEAELGFGNLKQTSGAWDAAVSFTNIKTLGYKKRNTYLHKKGYIFLTNYDGLEDSVFFSSDQTLTNGDYRTIARCRVMHKSRRVVRRALLPYVNSSVEVDTATGYMSASAITMFQNVVLNALDANMVEPGTSVPQISGRSCNIDAEQNILENDQLLITYTLVPLGTTSVISVTEGFVSTIESA